MKIDAMDHYDIKNLSLWLNHGRGIRWRL